MDSEKEEVWERLKYVRRGKLVSPGVSVRTVDISYVMPAKDEVWRILSETEQEKKQRIITEMLENAQEEIAKLQLIRDGKAS